MAASTFRVRLFGANDQFLARWNITVPRVKKKYDSAYTHYVRNGYINCATVEEVDAVFGSDEYIESLTNRISWGVKTIESDTFTPEPNWPRRMQLFGYGNCIDLKSNYLVAGTKLVFDNGSYYQVSRTNEITNNYTVYFDVYLSDGTKINTNEFSWNAYCNIKNSPRHPADGTTLPFPCGTEEGDYNCYIIGGWTYQFNLDNIQVMGTLEKYGDVSASMWQRFLEGLKDVDGDNPYWDGGTTEEGGGDGGFGDNSDVVTEDSMPTISAIGSGFATIFTPTRTQLKYLSELFWSSDVFTFLQNLVENITDMFISLGMVPFTINPGRTVSVTWLGIDTAIELRLAAAQYYEFNMGSIDMADDLRIYTSGSALDYSPFSRLGIFLPFIGYQELDIDECRGKTITLKYRIDILSGACVALISIAGSTIYQFAGNCMAQIPITSQNFENLITNVVNVGIAAAGVKNASAIAGGGDAMAAQGSKAMAKRAAMYDKVGAIDPSVLSSKGHLANASANAMMGLKPSFNKSGAVSSSASLLSVRQPYLFLTTPRQCIPEHYQRYHGFPSNITDTLGNFSGYTVVDSIRLNDLVATSNEIEEIYSLLHAGVII